MIAPPNTILTSGSAVVTVRFFPSSSSFCPIAVNLSAAPTAGPGTAGANGVAGATGSSVATSFRENVLLPAVGCGLVGTGRAPYCANAKQGIKRASNQLARQRLMRHPPKGPWLSESIG